MSVSVYFWETIYNLPTMSAHHLHNECTLMRVSGRDNGIDSLDDTMQCRISADGHVGATEIVIDWTNHTGNVQYTVFGALFLRDFTILEQFVR